MPFKRKRITDSETYLNIPTLSWEGTYAVYILHITYLIIVILCRYKKQLI